MIANAEVPTTHAGAVVYRGDPITPEFLLVEASKSSGEWVLPKGHIEPGEDPPAAALREVLEEAGVEAELVEGGARLGLSDYKVGGVPTRVIFFLGRCVRESPYREKRRKVWLPADSAEAALAHEESRNMLRRANERLVELLQRDDI